MLRTYVFVTSLLILAGCQKEAAAPTAPSAPAEVVKPGLYRVALKLPGGDLPFGLALEAQGDVMVAYLINGPERQQVNEVTVKGSHLEILMPGYENKLIADATGNTLKGEVVLSKSGAKEQHIPMSAELGPEYRFYQTPATDNADLSGRWAMSFVEDDSGEKEADVGEFTQTHDVVTGTILTPTGDHRYLAGQVHGDELDLSTFDGAHAFLYKGKLAADGTLSGDWWSGTAYHEKWTAKRDANAKLVDAYTFTNMKKGEKKFDFSFPDLDGNTVSSRDAKFKGKVMIVALAGSWCPNCHDEAAFLEPLYHDYRDKGVEVVSLMFEHFGDFPRAAEATKRFRAHYGIEYTTLIAGISDKDEAGKKLPMLEKFKAFPTTVFIDTKGNVRKIHTGFTGPATGEHYTQFVDEVHSTLDSLLKEG